LETPLHINRVQCAFVYQRELDIRKKAFEFENKLTEYFNRQPFSIIGVPDDADPNIPRFECRYKGDHLTVSQMRAVWEISFHDNIPIENIETIISKRINSFSNILQVQVKKILFAGIIIDSDSIFENENDILTLFKENTKATFLDNKNLKEYTIHYSVVYKENFFLNIKCSKALKVEHKITINRDRRTGEIKKGNSFNCLNLLLDINTKPLGTKEHAFDIKYVSELIENSLLLLSKTSIENYLRGNI